MIQTTEEIVVMNSASFSLNFPFAYIPVLFVLLVLILLQMKWNEFDFLWRFEAYLEPVNTKLILINTAMFLSPPKTPYEQDLIV